jgi:hypothetical protein
MPALTEGERNRRERPDRELFPLDASKVDSRAREDEVEIPEWSI